MSVASPSVRPALRTLAVAAVLFGGTLLLFSRGIGYDFSNYDDPAYILNNPHVRAGLTWRSVVWAFTGAADYWHPLTWLSHMLDWQLYGENAGGHHLTSVLWHAINAVLAWVVFRRLTGRFWLSALSAALFAWHPLRVESVIWITERKDVMSGCFFLLTIWAYVNYAERRRASRRAWPQYVLTLALFLGGLMCKPMLVTLPAVLLLLDVWPLGRTQASAQAGRRWLALVIEKLPLVALSAVIAVVTVLMQRDRNAFVLELSFGARAGNAVISVARYLGKFFWPFDLTVCYPHPGSWPATAIGGATLLVIALSAVTWWQRRSRPWLLVGWAWYLVMLLPAIGLVQVGFQAMADRYTYTPILGWQLALLLTVVPRLTTPGRRWTAAVASLLVMIGSAARTWNQEATWRDPATLFEHALAVTRRNEFAHALLGYTYVSQHRYDDAVRQCRKALELNPRNETALLGLAEVAQRRGAIDDAIDAYEKVVRLSPHRADSEFSLGLLLIGRGRLDEGLRHLKSAARRDADVRAVNLQLASNATLHGEPQSAALHFEVAVAADPADASAEYGWGYVLGLLGRTDEAMVHYRRALALRPDYPEAHTELGLQLLTRGKPEEAAGHFREALATQPTLGLAHFGLSRASEQLHDSAAAVAQLERAIALAPNHPLVQRAWAQMLARRGQFVEAVPHYRESLRLLPGDAATHAELGYALWLGGRRTEAAAEWREALRLAPDFPGLRARMEQLGVR